jgi:hypothetical protein
MAKKKGTPPEERGVEPNLGHIPARPRGSLDGRLFNSVEQYRAYIKSPRRADRPTTERKRGSARRRAKVVS